MLCVPSGFVGVMNEIIIILLVFCVGVKLDLLHWGEKHVEAV
jgi:hypothetical protein